MVEKRAFQKALMISTFEQLHPNVDKQLIEDILYKAAVILLKRKRGLFQKKVEIYSDDIKYIMHHWDNKNNDII